LFEQKNLVAQPTPLRITAALSEFRAKFRPKPDRSQAAPLAGAANGGPAPAGDHATWKEPMKTSDQQKHGQKGDQEGHEGPAREAPSQRFEQAKGYDDRQQQKDRGESEKPQHAPSDD
jgi:hypothetical protein